MFLPPEHIDGVEQERISGNVDWQSKTYGISSGSHTVKWTYTKDGSVNRGSDCGWRDKVEFGGDSYEPDNSFNQYSTMSVTFSYLFFPLYGGGNSCGSQATKTS